MEHLNKNCYYSKMCPNQGIFIRATFYIKDLHYQWLLFNKCQPYTKANFKVWAQKVKLCELLFPYLHLIIKEQVSKLEIPMNHMVFVKIVACEDDLTHKVTSLGLRHLTSTLV